MPTKYPLSIAQAKRIAREKLGRNLRIGHEVAISTYPVQCWHGQLSVTRTATLYLVNESGKFRLREYVPVN